MRKKISDEEADKLLEEQYIREAKEMEAGLLRSAGIDPEEESEPEAEEKWSVQRKIFRRCGHKF